MLLIALVVLASPDGAFASTAPRATASTGVRLAGGNGHSCAVTSHGQVECWGLGTDGELGNGTAVTSSRPTVVRGLSDVRSVTAGAYHSCALSAAGTVSCWGYNFGGELGAGMRSGPEMCTRRRGESAQPCSTVPLRVVGLQGVRAIDAGAYHTCALRADRTVACWGSGQLGDGSTRTSATPVIVTGLTGVRAITAGGTSTCALLLNGTVRCWGSPYPSRPTAITGLAHVQSIAAGYYHVCAALASGRVQCWGRNNFGQLGDGTFTSSSRPQNVLDVQNARAVTGGEGHACALLADHTVRCWGYDQWGQIGVRPNVTPSTSCDGGAPCHPIPVRVAGLAGVNEIAAGFKHTCVVTTTEAVKCFGYAGDGELGPGTRNSSYVPVTVEHLQA